MSPPPFPICPSNAQPPQIRADDHVAGQVGTKIFGLTGNALSEDVNEFKQSGCDEVLTKPLSTPKLKEFLTTHGIEIPKQAAAK